MTSPTNGYLMKVIRRARRNESHLEHSDAVRYCKSFRALEDHLYNEQHGYTDAGLAIAGAECQGTAGETERASHTIMTTHGCRHVADLLHSLDSLAENVGRNGPDLELDVQEAYILLCAAHLHDVGNIAGRVGHPERSGEIISAKKELFVGTFARQYIFDVASAHGGEDSEFGKDTIRRIRSGITNRPRLQLLAAMLRLGDELSENPERAPEALIRRFRASPESCLAFGFARCFDNFRLEGESLTIDLRIYPELHSLRVAVDGETVTFYDYLEKRIDKIEMEARYCSQYGRPLLSVREIKIAIYFYKRELPSRVANLANLTLDLEQGYPDDLRVLRERCPELAGEKSLKDYVEQGERSGA